MRYALRTLTRTPGFTSIAVLTLALGIGANTAIFSLVHAVLLKPLPFRDPGKLIAIWDTYLPQYPKLGLSPLEVEAWQQQSGLFEQTAWYRSVPQDLNLTTAGSEALEVHVAPASDRLFPTLGVTAALGRTFGASEDAHSAILSDKLWRSRFGGDRNIAGKTVRLNEQTFTIVGVMPRGFQFPDWADLWLTKAQMGDEMTNPVRHAAGLIARLRPGATEQQAAARVETIAGRLASEHPKTSRGFGMRLYGLQEDLTANVRPALLLLLGAVAMVLLIACANVANLLLSRASGRSKEMAVRAALGAGVWRLARQLLTESLVLAAMGGAAGIVLGEWALRVLAPEPVPLDPMVLLILMGISLTAGVAFGLAPIFHALRSDANSVIKSGSVTGGGSSNVRAVMVVAEVALAMVLTAGAGILVKSFLRLMHVDPGFDPRGVLTLRISVPPSRKPDVLFHRIEERVRALPGVDGVAVANVLPLVANRAFTTRFNVPGSPLINPDALPAAQIRLVSPDYFRTLRIPLRSGRVFGERDLTGDGVIINEGFARRYWPGKDVVGLKFITGPWGSNPTWSTIIGVVADVKQFGLDSEPTMELYFPNVTPKYILVRTSGDPLSLAAAVRRAIGSIDGDLPVTDLRTMDQVLAESARSRRWTMALLGGFAGLAVVLALVGIYGVMSWTVAQRTREIGIRMALGAQTGQVLTMVVRYALKLSAVGVAIGVGGALALRRVLAGFVFETSAADPLTYIAVVMLMLAAALLAGYVPARRASRADPLVALRWE
jgi:predicted permease